ncbi:MAG: DUF3458 domain-containing protein, partial [Sulfitobacter sp.]|nr:DUF3458 domain-containing protein [Sulfitobacter sp.]
TCRDWFQLCLQEGLTVYRDSQFTADMRSAPVKRISDVIDLRARQFPEDQGPLAHPVRPEAYQEINNFYTATVYEKGAEVIGMLKRLVGEEDYYKALALYFDRHDGDAATIEDWLKVFEDATGRDLTQFKRWYSQAGTPHLRVEESFELDTLTLTFHQETPASTATPDPQPQVIPIAVGLIYPDGTEALETRVLEMTKATQSFRFTGLSDEPVASILRDFSAPVVLHQDLSDADRAHLLMHDTDPLNRWEQGRTLARAALLRMITPGAEPDPPYLDGNKTAPGDAALDPATRALMLALPSEAELATALHEQGTVPDPSAIHAAHEAMAEARAAHLADIAPQIHAQMQVTEPYQPNAEQSGKRVLGNTMLAMITRRDGGTAAQAQFDSADNMNQQSVALALLIKAGAGEKALAAFEDQWREDRLVMDKWFGLQVMQAAPAEAAETVQRLTDHPAFNWKNPNRFRAVFGALAGNHAGFHYESGEAYRLLADWLIKLDPLNPQTTARMCAAFQTWKRYDSARQDLIATQLDRILAQPDLSRDTTEMLSRIRGA